MTNTYLRKKMIFIIDESQRILEKVHSFHKINDIYNKKDFHPKYFNYYLSLITALSIIDDKITTLLKKISSFNKKTSLPIKDAQIAKLQLMQKRIKCAKEIEKRFL